MKYRVFGIFTVCCGLFICQDNRAQDSRTDTELEEKISRYISASARERVNLNPSERDRMIEYSKRQLAATRQQGAPNIWLNYLVRLGDEETIRNVVKTEDHAWSWSRDLINSGSPIAVEVLMPLVFKEEPLVNRIVGDVEHTSISHHLASTVVPAIIMRSSAFNPKVVEWAKKVRGNTGPNANVWLNWCRATMRAWWQQNEPFFRTKQYASVQPGLNPPWVNQPPPNEPEPVPLRAQPEIAPPAKEAQVTHISTPTPSLKPNSTDQKRDSSGNLSLYAGIAIAAIAVAVWLTRRKR
jgi:hypothetical protein